MYLNTLKPAVGASFPRVRVGRGMGSGLGKTCGRGHKGAKARSGYSRSPGFEGGQLPLQRRVPKFGFTSPTANDTVELRLSALNRVTNSTVSLQQLKTDKLVGIQVKRVRVILAGELQKALTIVDLHLTAGAKAAVIAAGGMILGSSD